MQAVARAARLLIAAGLSAVTALAAASPAAAAGGGHQGNGCTGYTAGSGWFVQCGTSSTPSGSTSQGGPSCYWAPDASRYWPHLPPAPPGYVWLVTICPPGAGNAGPGAMTYSAPILAPGGGALTPAVLAQRAYAELRPPLPDPRTAPPRRSDGLVGLPEWFWVPKARWAPQTARIAAGGVWAAVTATPSELVISPGGGLPAMSCPGPGTAYNPSFPALEQHSDCTYTYAQSSDGLPGNAYQVTVTVTWTAIWRGSGGSGGTLPALTRATTFSLPVAEAQALNPGS